MGWSGNRFVGNGVNGRNEAQMQSLALKVTTALAAGGWADKPEGRLLSLSVLQLWFEFCCWPPLQGDTQPGWTDLRHDTWQPSKYQRLPRHILSRAELPRSQVRPCKSFSVLWNVTSRDSGGFLYHQMLQKDFLYVSSWVTFKCG